jgi:hypothetical protein
MPAEETEVKTSPRRAQGVPHRGCGAEWLDLLSTGQKLVCAGLRRSIGPEGDLQAAYRQWYHDQMREHDELLVRTQQRLHAAEMERGDAS